jgi:hypothetical protein
MTRKRDPVPILVLRWAARIWGAAAALLLLAIFAEHIQEWFRDPKNLPPPFVFVAQACHLAFFLGLVAAWRWELRGALLALAGAGGFFAATGAAWGMLPFLGVTSMPAILWLCSAWLAHRHAGRAET